MACGQGGHRIMTHDSVKFCIKDLLNSCGIKIRVEVAECFRVAIPENNQRPDLMLYNAPDFNKPVVADVCITCPIPVAASAPLSLTNARKPGRAAQLARSGKETKYMAACDANGLELLPICIESTIARWGKACDNFFKKVLKANSKGNESVYRAFSNYWISRLSCCLQKSIAASIVNRSKLINGDMLHNPNYQFDKDFILESGFQH
jgi:hypothetical protein